MGHDYMVVAEREPLQSGACTSTAGSVSFWGLRAFSLEGKCHYRNSAKIPKILLNESFTEDPPVSPYHLTTELANDMS